MGCGEDISPEATGTIDMTCDRSSSIWKTPTAVVLEVPAGAAKEGPSSMASSIQGPCFDDLINLARLDMPINTKPAGLSAGGFSMPLVLAILELQRLQIFSEVGAGVVALEGELANSSVP